jgi:hypothetical protein
MLANDDTFNLRHHIQRPDVLPTCRWIQDSMPSRHEQEFQIEPSSSSKALVADMGSTAAVIVTHPWGTGVIVRRRTVNM